MPESIKIVILVGFITFLSISLLSFHHESPELLYLYCSELRYYTELQKFLSKEQENEIFLLNISGIDYCVLYEL